MLFQTLKNKTGRRKENEKEKGAGKMFRIVSTNHSEYVKN